jgi:integrase
MWAAGRTLFATAGLGFGNHVATKGAGMKDTKEGELFKYRVNRYYDAEGKRTSPNTPGARKTTEETKKWYVRLKDPATGKWKRYPLSRDKQVARQMAANLEKRLARAEAGLADPHEETMHSPITTLVDAYIADLAEQGRDERYRGQTKREIDRVVAACGADRLAELTPDKVDNFLTKLSCSARSKNSYRRAVIGLCNYLVRKRKLPYNPLLVTTRRKGELKRKRRALADHLLQKLLDAARQRPLLEAMTIRRGPRKGQLAARVRPEERARLERIGRHRALLYLTAILTGLRLGTLRRLRVGYLDLEGPVPQMGLPGNIMKSKRDFFQHLREDLVAELRAWVAETGKKPGDLLFEVPAYSQTSKLLRKDLRTAGIPYRDEAGRYFDFHSFRKCSGTFLRKAGVDPTISMHYLDHSDIRMTMEVYADGGLLDMRAALDAMPRLTIR